MKVKAAPDTPAVMRHLELAGATGTKRALRQAWFEVGRHLTREANREILKGRKTGRVYIFRSPSGRRRRHRASAPGETHANLTGALRKSIGWKMTGARGGDFGYGVAGGSRTAPPYAGAIEFGRDDGTIAPRPSLLNAINASERDIRDELILKFDEVFRP